MDVHIGGAVWEIIGIDRFKIWRPISPPVGPTLPEKIWAYSAQQELSNELQNVPLDGVVSEILLYKYFCFFFI